MDYRHNPVLLEECIRGLEIKPGGIYVDGTLGRGGHSLEILKRLDTGFLIGIDRDPEAVTATKDRLGEYGRKFIPVHGSFGNIAGILDKLDVGTVDGMLFDLGVSSPQLDDVSRGFSYMADAPLDMRMDTSAALTARDVVNGYDESELKRILYKYGEERYSDLIVSAIIKKRKIKPIETTLELSEIISRAMPPSSLREKQHPAKRTFQALRIEVNNELGELEKMLSDAPDRLRTGGRIAVISFHSLEDRLVKLAFREREKGCKCPPGLPVCACGFVRTLKVITKNPITASKEELENNPRARSAKLRIAERV